MVAYCRGLVIIQAPTVYLVPVSLSLDLVETGDLAESSVFSSDEFRAARLSQLGGWGKEAPYGFL